MYVHHSSESRNGTAGSPRTPSLNSTTERHSSDATSGPCPSVSLVCSRASTYSFQLSEQGSAPGAAVFPPPQDDAMRTPRSMNRLVIALSRVHVAVVTDAQDNPKAAGGTAAMHPIPVPHEFHFRVKWGAGNDPNQPARFKARSCIWSLLIRLS